MAYRALYREYRPKTFSEVIGQDHITTVLKNQVAADHIAHAYLFCGTRGTGKTSTAKILARAVNCLDPVDGEPCMECPACKAALEEGCVDIMELDAASNNGVDDARDIIDQAQYAPLSLRRRVFIIDEVHMLTTQAFNALLKTLEEPPAHVLFILATTEPQRLPATIISRCQRFDFHRLSVSDIVKNLKIVLKKAGAEVDDEGLMLIARAADGGMRDALSLTDQCLSFIGDHVTATDVYDVLGSMEEGFLFTLVDALIESNTQKAMALLDEVVRGGRSLTVFANDLTAHLRALLLAKTCGSCEDLLDCTKDAMARYLEQSKRVGETRLLMGIEALMNAQGNMRYLSAPRTLLESVLIRICRPEDELSLDGVLARLEKLEQNGIPAAVCRQAAPTASAGPAQAPSASAPAGPAPKSDADVPDGPPPLEAPPEEAPPLDVAPPSSEPARRAVVPRPAASSRPARNEPSALPENTDAAGFWGAILTELHSQNILVHALAQYGAPVSYQDHVLTIGFDKNHAAQRMSLNAPINMTKLQAILTKLAPEARLSLVEAHATPAGEDDIARAKAIFGDKLIIKE